MNEECEVCAFDFNRSNRKKIECKKCGTKVCRACFVRYLEDSSEDAHCLACSSPWGRDFLSSVMTKVFMNREYRKHREKLMFEKQQAMLTNTLPYVESQKRMQKLSAEKNEIHEKIRKLWLEVSQIENLLHSESTFYFGTETKDSLDRPITIVGHCVLDDCNGLVDLSWKCTTCETPICKRCTKSKEENHVCDEEDIASLRLIRSDSRPCPNCKVRIHLYEGCNQAWCTNCHTAFNWRTMKLIRSGFFHNPHFAEWQVQNGRDGLPVENYRQGCIDFQKLNGKIKNESHSNHSEEVSNTMRMRGYLLAANHILDYESTDVTNESNMKLRGLRVDFLMNKIDQQEFKERSQRVDKAMNKANEIASIMNMFAHSARDILSDWVDSESMTHDKCEETLLELYNYTKSCLCNAHSWFNPFYKKDGSFVYNTHSEAMRYRNSY